MRRGIALRVAVTTAITSLIVLSGAQGANERAWYSSAREACAGQVAKMVCYHQQVRRKAGLPALRRSPQLERAARLKERRIIQCHRVTHEPCGESFDRPFAMVGYLRAGSWIIGENLAWGWESPWAAFDALMHSSSHRANVLRRGFRELGVAQARSPWGPLWVVEYGHRW